MVWQFDRMKLKLPMVFQSEIVECGLAALVMILRYYGHDVRLAELRHLHPVSLSGLSLTSLVNIAKKNNLNCKVIRIEPEDMNKITLPAILHWNLNHFVVLKEIKRNKYTLHDPGKGVVKISKLDFSASFTGIAIECTPDANFSAKTQSSKKSFLSLILKIDHIKTLLFKLFIFTLIYQLFLLIAPKYLKQVIDVIIPSHNINLLITLTMGYIGLRVLTSIAKLLKSLCLLKLDADLSLKFGTDIAQHIIYLPLSYFEKRQLGDILYRFNSVDQFRQIISNGLIEGWWGGLLMITTLLMMSYLQPSLTLITLLFTILVIAFSCFIIKQRQLKYAEMLTAKSQEQTSFLENVRAIQPIKIFAKESARMGHWHKNYVSFLKTSYKVNFVKMLSENGKEILQGLEIITVIFFASFNIVNQKLTLGLFYTYLFYRQQFSDSLHNFIEKMADFKLLGTYQERLEDIVCHPIEFISTNHSIPYNYSISVESLSYRYSELEPFIFSNINFSINSGECIAIVGPSGIGKTTLLKVIMGLLQPSQGQVKIGDTPLSAVKNYRHTMTSVMQNDCLLNGSIAQNIAFFSDLINIDKVHHCTKLVGIYDEIMCMPMRFDTLVSEMGATLSGGQKQRILLARALYANPKILLLDEATSHLDVMKEREVNRAIKSLGITCLMIAHREETIKMADRVITLQQ